MLLDMRRISNRPTIDIERVNLLLRGLLTRWSSAFEAPTVYQVGGGVSQTHALRQACLVVDGLGISIWATAALTCVCWFTYALFLQHHAGFRAGWTDMCAQAYKIVGDC
jgi:hypothetical protein